MQSRFFVVFQIHFLPQLFVVCQIHFLPQLFVVFQIHSLPQLFVAFHLHFRPRLSVVLHLHFLPRLFVVPVRLVYAQKAASQLQPSAYHYHIPFRLTQISRTDLFVPLCFLHLVHFASCLFLAFPLHPLAPC